MLLKVLAVSTFFLLVACGNNKDKSGGTASGNDLSGNPDYEKGLALIAKSDCLTCHKVDQPVNGPAYRDVANKYANKPDTIVSYLAQKIIKGGSGNWGSIFMTPHPSISREDAEAMVKYVLLLKK
jgi:cytochrome c